MNQLRYQNERFVDMRAIAQEITIYEYKFVMEFDTGGEHGGDYTCWIYYNDKPLLKSNRRQVRKEFGTEFNFRHFKNFANKFATD